MVNDLVINALVAVILRKVEKARSIKKARKPRKDRSQHFPVLGWVKFSLLNLSDSSGSITSQEVTHEQLKR